MINDKASTEYQFYISSLVASAELLGKGIRDDWGVENKVHHVLDVAYCEDKSRVRKDHGAENLSIMRRVVLNMLKAERSRKLSTNKKRTLAAMQPEYRLTLLDVSMNI